MPMVMMQLGEVVFGGVGSGLYGMLVFAIVTVFVAWLMVGRTPEYLGKKIGAYEMKMAPLVTLIPCCLVLLATALSFVWPSVDEGVSQGVMGMANNNGSAFGGYSANVPFHNYVGGVVMWLFRFWIMVPVLANAGALARKEIVPVGPGTLPTHTPLFVVLLCSIVLIVGALTFIPALAPGPIVEQLRMAGG